MERITVADAQLPEVKLIIPRAKFDALPAEIRDELNYFAVDEQTGRYLVPGYRFADWQKPTK